MGCILFNRRDGQINEHRKKFFYVKMNLKNVHGAESGLPDGIISNPNSQFG
jgi:hypothetical protein